MATLNRIEIKKRRKKRARLKKKLRCRFCPDGCNHSPRPIYVDFKDLKTLRLMIDREGHIQSRRRTGNCAKYQRAVRRAVLMARFMGLLPYVSEERRPVAPERARRDRTSRIERTCRPDPKSRPGRRRLPPN